MFGQISLGKWGMMIGGSLAIVGFIAYGYGNATLNLAGFFYGIPLLLGGLALKAAELKPTPYSQQTPHQIVQLREQQATATQQQIRKDVTRYRYGQAVHLEESLQRLGLSPSDEERPVLKAIREAAIEGYYALVLEFESPYIPLATWQEKREKIERFFGPNVRAEVKQPQADWVEVALIAVSREQQES